jgi:hypothetical protein
MNRLTRTPSGTGAAASIVLLAAMTFAGAAFGDAGSANPASTPASAAASVPASPATKPTVDRDEQRIKDLHDKLKITSAQEVLWSKVAEIMRSNDEKIDALAKARHDKASAMTAVDDLRSYGEITEAHAAGIRAFTPAFASLYESMSAEQKANADHVFRTAGHKPAKKAP